MKRMLALFLAAVTLCGCRAVDEVGRGMALREKLLGAGCAFTGEITADYGDEAYVFAVECREDGEGTLTFTVTAPESIAGITGSLSKEGGNLTFDRAVLAFPLMADGQFSPVSLPWLVVHTLRGGYLAAAAREGELLRLSMDDSYGENPLRLDIWVNEENLPVRGEVLWEGRRILSLDIKDFGFL